MAVFLANIWRIILMLLLLGASAFFSGSETAFFNVSRRRLQGFGSSARRLENMAARLLRMPNRLLTSILLGNMTVNVLYFALASVLSINLAQSIHPAAAGIIGAFSFMLLLLFGEMLPKSLAWSNSTRFCLAATPVCYVFVRLLAPLLALFEFAVVKPTVRMLTFHPQPHIDGMQANVGRLKILIEASRKQGLITPDENQLLLEIIEFSHLKVRHVMRPRVDMQACEISTAGKTVRRIMSENNLTKMPVYTRQLDDMAGFVHIRKLLLEPDKPVRDLLEKIHFVPEQKTVESLIGFFQDQRTDMAVVVDEYGGIAGQVLLADIIDELIGPLAEQPTDAAAIEQIAPTQYRIAGNLAIHDWAEAFGIDPGKSRLATVGGFTAALLGRIPTPGDVAHLKNITLTVEKVTKHRIETLILTLEPITEQDRRPNQ